MDQFLDKMFLDNSLRAYIAVLISILFALFLKRILSKYIAGLIFRLLQKRTSGIEKATFIELVVRPLEVFIVLLITVIALDKLTYPGILDVSVYKSSLRRLLDNLTVSVIIIAFFSFLIRLVDFIGIVIRQRTTASQDHSDSQLIIFFKDIVKAVLFVIAALMVAQFGFKKDVSGLVTGLSIATAAIALATKESLENLIASFIIFFDKPFATGDAVKVNAISGVVERIGLRSTRIRTDQKTYVTVPNKQMVDSVLDNLSLRSQFRVDIKLNVSLNTASEDITYLVNAIRKILQRTDISSNLVYFSEIGTSGYSITAEYYLNLKTGANLNGIKQEVNLQILEAMKARQIHLAAGSTDIRIVREQNGGDGGSDSNTLI